MLAADVKGERDLRVGQLDHGFRCGRGNWAGGWGQEGGRGGACLEMGQLDRCMWEGRQGGGGDAGGWVRHSGRGKGLWGRAGEGMGEALRSGW